MSFRIGDTVFNHQGRPGVVADRDPLTKELKVNQDPVANAEHLRHGYINGLSQEQREEFAKILDSVKEEKDPKKRVEDLQTRIQELQMDPKNRVMTRYLTAEMSHIMFTHGIVPQTYTTFEDRVRS